jgi:thiol:disulfide interchange protein DsbD
MLLNLMPCVLPVLSLKILSFIGQSGGSPARARQLGLIYGAGVVLSLLVLAGVVIAGKLGSWGQQYQSPVFIVLTTTLVTLVTLNLFGVFEVTLGGSVMGAAGDLSSREGPAGAFFNGVLTVVLATPCTARRWRPRWATPSTNHRTSCCWCSRPSALAWPRLTSC